MKYATSLDVRFLSLLDKTGSCWLFKGSLDHQGYGRFKIPIIEHKNGKYVKAHRFAYQLFKGDPGEFDVCHTCDNPPCCNPEHLFLGTHQDNMKDMANKGRAHVDYGEGNKVHKFSTEQVLAIRKDTRSLRIIAKEYKMAKSTASAIRNRKSRIFG
jgi:hypothetical protein